MSSKPEPTTKRRPRAARNRRWLFRFLAVLLSLSPLAACEALCRLFDWGRPELHDDPFVGFRSVRPLFVLGEDQTRYEIPPARQSHFRPESFPAVKADNEFRIFCLGGSTVQGRPFAVETSFSSWLEISLQAADPGRRWEVVNCGGISYASYRLVPILQEILQYEPDLIVLYTGHNEFLEDRRFDHIRNRGALLNASIATASRLRTFTLMREGYLRLRGISSTDPAGGRPLLPTEVEALLDYRGGLEAYHRDESWRHDVIAQYRYNLVRMVELAREAGVALILVNPVSNIGDSPPFKSEHKADLAPEQREQWGALLQAARQHFRREHYDVARAVPLLEQACKVDDLHAGTWYMLAECHRLTNRMEQARHAYLQAKEWDVCPLRILQPMNEAVLEIADQTRTPLVDAQGLFERNSPHRIVDGQWLVDHVHPTIEGHQLLAGELAAQLVAQGVVQPAADWEDRRKQRFREHLAKLDDLYFVKGTQRLEAVRDWARGRVEALRSPASGAEQRGSGQRL